MKENKLISLGSIWSPKMDPLYNLKEVAWYLDNGYHFFIIDTEGGSVADQLKTIYKMAEPYRKKNK